MNYTKRFYELIIKDATEKKVSDLPEFLKEEVDKAEIVKQKKREIQKSRDEANKIYKEKLKGLDEVEKELQKNCSHYEFVYHPDPSGNSDSYYECLICGKEL
jgi:hypothetical protein